MNGSGEMDGHTHFALASSRNPLNELELCIMLARWYFANNFYQVEEISPIAYMLRILL